MVWLATRDGVRVRRWPTPAGMRPPAGKPVASPLASRLATATPHCKPPGKPSGNSHAALQAPWQADWQQPRRTASPLATADVARRAPLATASPGWASALPGAAQAGISPASPHRRLRAGCRRDRRMQLLTRSGNCGRPSSSAMTDTMVAGVVREVVRSVPGRGGRPGAPKIERTSPDKTSGLHPLDSSAAINPVPEVQPFRSALAETAAGVRGTAAGGTTPGSSSMLLPANAVRVKQRLFLRPHQLAHRQTRCPQRHHDRHPIVQPASDHHPDPRPLETEQPQSAAHPGIRASRDTPGPVQGLPDFEGRRPMAKTTGSTEVGADPSVTLRVKISSQCLTPKSFPS